MLSSKVFVNSPRSIGVIITASPADAERVSVIVHHTDDLIKQALTIVRRMVQEDVSGDVDTRRLEDLLVRAHNTLVS